MNTFRMSKDVAARIRGQESHKYYPTAKSKAKSGVTILGIEETREVLTKLGKAVNLYSARALAMIAVDLLRKAQPRVPYDIGWLRQSGTATLKVGRSTQIVGVGKEDGTVEARFGGITKAGLKGVRTLRADVSYKRIGDGGEDVALWTHEMLHPYGSGRKPKARYPGTGPKYLEIPWLENVGEYIKLLESELSGKGFEDNISSISRIRQKRLGRYQLSYVDLVTDQIAFGGYFGPTPAFKRTGRRATGWKRSK